MNGVHDMGGMHGMGPIRHETNEPTFHEIWEGRVYALSRGLRTRGGLWNIDAFRHGIEVLPPAEYLRMSYYERWFAWMLRTAFALSREVFQATLSLWPDNPTVANFPAAFRLHPVGTWFVNSMIVSVGITAGKLVLSIPAAFAFGVLTFRGRDLAFAVVVGTMTVPYVITLLPTYVAVASLGYYDTLTGVIVPERRPAPMRNICSWPMMRARSMTSW